MSWPNRCRLGSKSSRHRDRGTCYSCQRRGMLVNSACKSMLTPWLILIVTLPGVEYFSQQYICISSHRITGAASAPPVRPTISRTPHTKICSLKFGCTHKTMTLKDIGEGLSTFSRISPTDRVYIATCYQIFHRSFKARSCGVSRSSYHTTPTISNIHPASGMILA
jgi:hypothetical protein